MQTYCWPGHQTQLLRALQQQQNNAQYCDTLLQTEGISIPAHSCVLAALSPYLSQKLSSVSGPPTGQKRQLRLPTVTSGTLLKLVVLLYSGELKVKGDAEQRDVLAAAHRLGIPGLEVGWTDRGAEQRRGCTAKVQEAQVQVDMSSRRGGAPQEKSVASTSTQTDPDQGEGRDPTINSLTIPTRLINESNSTSAALHPVVIQRTTGRDDGGVKSGGKGSGGADAAGQPRRTAVGVKSVARMRQMMESAQISIKVKLRRRTTGEASWEVVNIQDSDKTLVDNISLKQIHSQCSVSDSSPRSSTSFSTDQSTELEPPQALLEETDEQVQRMLEDIMFGLNIVPSIEKDCKKTQASDTDVHGFLLHQFEAHTPPPSLSLTPQRSEVVTPRDPQVSGDDPSFLCFDYFCLPQCLSPLATYTSPSDAQVSENDRTGIPSRALFPEVPESLHFPSKEEDAPRRQNSKDPECEEKEEVSNSEKTINEPNQQISECSVNLSCQNLLVTHQNLRGVLLGQSGATSVEHPRVTTRGSARKTQLVRLKTGTESSAGTPRQRRGQTFKIKVENVGKDLKDTENVAKVKNEETIVDDVNPVEKNVERYKRNIENMKKNVQNVKRNVKKMKKKVENMKKNVQNNLKDMETKEKKVENVKRNVKKIKKNMENNVENNMKDVETIKRNVKKIKKNMKKNVENNIKDVKIKEKTVEKDVENVREEEEGALKRRSRKRKRDVGVGRADAIPRNGKRKREKETPVDDKEVSRAETLKWFQELVQQQTFKRRRSKGSTETRTKEVSTAKEDEGRCVKTTEEEGERESGGITAVRISEEEGSEEAERQLKAADEVQAVMKESCEEEVDVVLCSPLRDTPACLSHAHSEDTSEDDEDVDVTGD
ncbi:uncharacterized protein LOC114460012 [Gouania willdenowi]|uniref:uncharacterized protein LOC114460012 n=1 Tax=Gouania willdenowi TaxID=441366 RepID=UPI001056C411|nr:uncharacterized protein LOC114460012 [Gouania willdenowi]